MVLLQEPDKLRQRAVYLSYDTGNTHHHAECQIALHYFGCNPECDENIPYLANDRISRVLYLPQPQAFPTHAVKFFLHPVPFPYLVLFVSVDFDIHNAVHHFEKLVLVPHSHAELFIIERFAESEKIAHPSRAQSRDEQVSGKDNDIVVAYDDQ